ASGNGAAARRERRRAPASARGRSASRPARARPGIAPGRSAELLELGAVALELVALTVDDVDRGVGDELLVTQLALRPRDLAAKPLPLLLDPRRDRVRIEMIGGEDLDH